VRNYERIAAPLSTLLPLSSVFLAAEAGSSIIRCKFANNSTWRGRLVGPVAYPLVIVHIAPRSRARFPIPRATPAALRRQELIIVPAI